MAGEHGKDRELDFAYWANLGGSQSLTVEEAEGLMGLLGFHRYQTGLEGAEALECALMQSENLYRVACLLAYGNGLADLCDIERFTVMADTASPSDVPKTRADNGSEEDPLFMLRVTLPYARWVDDARIPELLSTSVNHRQIVNPGKPTFLYVERSVYMSKGYQTYDLFGYPSALTAKRGGAYNWSEACRFMGQVIANAQTFNNYLGIYNGRPLFESRCGFDSLWQALAELADKQAPGICPVCGRVIDRRRNEKGGHPKKTCAAHSDKFQNMKKALQKSGDPDMRFADKCEEAVRQQRWNDESLNERPLRCES